MSNRTLDEVLIDDRVIIPDYIKNRTTEEHLAALKDMGYALDGTGELHYYPELDKVRQAAN
jgi:hypothetical protein